MRFSPHCKAATKKPASQFHFVNGQYLLTAGTDFIFYLGSGTHTGKQQ